MKINLFLKLYLKVKDSQSNHLSKTNKLLLQILEFSLLTQQHTQIRLSVGIKNGLML